MSNAVRADANRAAAPQSKLVALNEWVDSVAAHTQAAHVHWCDGSDAEYGELVELMLGTGDLIRLNEQTHPNCYLHRSSPSDVARVEHLTFVCTTDKDDAGPNNHWMSPADARAKMHELFAGCMKGRTLYVVPYCMGPIDSPIARCGVEITDSPYVAANMRIMTRMGAAALARIEREGGFVKGLHSTGDLTQIADSSCISPRHSRSRVLAQVTVAMHCSAKNVMRCASPAIRHERKAGSPSIC